MENPPTCRRCRSAKVLPVAYGIPTSELVGASVAGRVALGGRVAWAEAPDWLCVACGHDRLEDEGGNGRKP